MLNNSSSAPLPNSGLIPLSTIPKKKGPKHIRRLHVAENFISAYVRLPEDDKVYVEQFLALSAYDSTRWTITLLVRSAMV